MSQVILIRHGEKKKRSTVLSSKGQLRANELPNFFIKNIIPIKVPEIIIAMKQRNKHTSNRPLETVLPLAEQLKIPIIQFAKRKINKVVEFIKSNPESCILICWEHFYLVKIAKRITKLNNLKWGMHSKNGYTPVWLKTDTTFEIYDQFSVTKNGVDYSDVKSDPNYMKQLVKN